MSKTRKKFIRFLDRIFCGRRQRKLMEARLKRDLINAQRTYVGSVRLILHKLAEPGLHPKLRKSNEVCLLRITRNILKLHALLGTRYLSVDEYSDRRFSP